eukprot:scaffold3474_cov219-Chaetoceros_neogracile.AAC.3
MEDLNKIRMHPQVTTLSNITSANGKQFLPTALSGQRTNSCSNQAYDWPKSAQPSHNRTSRYGRMI